MSIKVMSMVWEHFPTGGPELLTILALADWADDDGYCFPSVAAVAKKTRVKRLAAQRALHRLIKGDFVKVVGNAFGGPPGATRKYRIAIGSLTGIEKDTGFSKDTGIQNDTDGYLLISQTGIPGDTQTIINRHRTVRDVKRARAPTLSHLTACPEFFEVTESMSKWAQGKGLPAERVLPETDKFLDYHRAKGNRFLDWDAGWRNWIAKAVEFRGGV